MIAQRRAAGLDGLVEHAMNGADQALGVIGGLSFLVASVAADLRGDSCERNSASQT